MMMKLMMMIFSEDWSKSCWASWWCMLNWSEELVYWSSQLIMTWTLEYVCTIVDSSMYTVSQLYIVYMYIVISFINLLISFSIKSCIDFIHLLSLVYSCDDDDVCDGVSDSLLRRVWQPELCSEHPALLECLDQPEPSERSENIRQSIWLKLGVLLLLLWSSNNCFLSRNG